MVWDSSEGTLNIELKEYISAALNFEKCLNFNKNNSYVYSSLAVVFERQNHYDKAIDYLKKSISLDSNNARALSNLGIIFCSFSEAVANNPNLV